MAISTWQVLILAAAIMAFAAGTFLLTYSADLPDAGAKRRTRKKGWGLLAVFVAGLLIAGL